ncbi:hypothetical protein [Candidatus Thiosymbion oneisti]|uniref:hypothetical protein n=1 Tax=Candidatus Thiosymbion oneisti TaxID=589554 RepID=UPI000B7DA140|nr:hypothetical protein [Candidatus Thiosymbion oneisti]
MTKPGNEEKKTIQFSVNLPKSLIGLGSEVTQAIRDPFLVFLIVLALLVSGVLWLFPEYMKHLPLLYTYIALVVVLAGFGMWAHRATIRQEKDSLLVEKNNLLIERERLAEELRNTCDDYQHCLERLAKRVAATKTRATPS